MRGSQTMTKWAARLGLASDCEIVRESYLLAVPSTASLRDLKIEPPQATGCGRPCTRPWQSVSKWAAAQPEDQ